MNNPKVSVVVPVYNVETYVEECIVSLLSQTYNNFEALIVDDGSTDHSGDIVEKYARTDSRLHVVHTKNHGLSAARNTGLDSCNGEFICFLDSDDFIEPNYLEHLVNLIDGSEYDFVSCAANFVDEKGKRIRRNEYPEKSKIISESIWETYFHTNLIEDAVWNKIYKRELFSDIRFAEGLIYEDSEIIIRILKQCKKVLFTSEYLYNYRIRAGSILGYTGTEISRTEFSVKKLDILKVYKLCADELKETEWAKSYYKRMIYSCADLMIQLHRADMTNLCSNVYYYYKIARKYYRLDNFPVKERIIIIFEIYFPGIWIKLRSCR